MHDSCYHRTYPREKAKLTLSDMELAARVHEERSSGVDFEDMQGEILPDGTEVRNFTAFGPYWSPCNIWCTDVLAFVVAEFGA